MKLTLISKEPSGIVRVLSEGNILSGDLPSTGVNPLEAVVGPDWAQLRICLDMSKTDHIDSSAIGWLISTLRQCRSNGGAFVTHSLQPGVRQVLDLVKIGKVVPLLESEPQAMAALGG